MESISSNIIQEMREKYKNLLEGKYKTDEERRLDDCLDEIEKKVEEYNRKSNEEKMKLYVSTYTALKQMAKNELTVKQAERLYSMFKRFRLPQNNYTVCLEYKFEILQDEIKKRYIYSIDKLVEENNNIDSLRRISCNVVETTGEENTFFTNMVLTKIKNKILALSKEQNYSEENIKSTKGERRDDPQTIVQKLIISNKLEIANEVCEDLKNNKKINEENYGRLKKEILTKKVKNHILDLLNNPQNPAKENLIFRNILRTITKNGLNPKNINLGISKDGLRIISLSEILSFERNIDIDDGTDR